MSTTDRLSYAARGLLGELAQRDPDTDPIGAAHYVTDKNKAGNVRTLLDELETEGFLRRWRTVTTRGDTGKLSQGPRWAWQLYPDGDAPTE